MSAPVDWSRFRDWLHCVCVVTFDLELGQAIELVHPAGVRLSDAERTAVCYLSFPDSNSGCLGDTRHHVRLRVQQPLTGGQRRFGERCATRLAADAGHLWGFVYVRQRRDERLQRGYFQKSLVLLTRLPFVQLFGQLSAAIGPPYFDADCDAGEPDPVVRRARGLAVLEAACDQINRWPALRAGRSVRLPLLGTVWRTFLEARDGSASLASSVDDEQPPDADDDDEPDDDGRLRREAALSHRFCAAQDVDMYAVMRPLLGQVHVLWELVLIGEPIVVMGASPGDTAHMVHTLTSLIAPLHCATETRPYFTIHDSEFRELTGHHSTSDGTGSAPPTNRPPIILGVTNPFFAKTLRHWPHTVRLLPVTGCDEPAEPAGHSSLSAALTAVGKRLRHRPSSTAPSTAGLVAGAVRAAFERPAGLNTVHRPFLDGDASARRQLLAMLHGPAAGQQRPAAVQAVILRRHMRQLTDSLLWPLERYLATLMPLRRDLRPFHGAPPAVGAFRPDAFLARLATGGPQLTSSLRGDWPGLYRRFFRTATFRRWLDGRLADLQRSLRVMHLQLLAQADIDEWLRDRHEVELVDMVMRLQQHIVHALQLTEADADDPAVEPSLCTSCGRPAGPSAGSSGGNAELLVRLRQHMRSVLRRLPADIRSIIRTDRLASDDQRTLDGCCCASS